MFRIPLVVRVSIGLAATTVTEIRNLPTTMASMPVTALSQVLQNYMRVQQQVTALAIRGDEVLSFLHPAEESPSWATFDAPPTDSEPMPKPVRRSGGKGRFALYSTVPETTRNGHSAPKTAATATPAPLAGYDTMTLAQLRARLRTLSLAELEALLAHEQGNENRAPFLTMLTNRISTVRTQ